MTRAIREHLRDFVAIGALIVVGLVTTGVILASQTTLIPSWIPILGEDTFEVKAEFSSAQAVTPGQGQTVTIAGINVGQVSAAELESGRAIVTMQIEPKYASLIHPDASLLLRPRTGLQDMTIELDPGAGDQEVQEGSTLPLASSQPNVQPDQILATLDGDTRSFLQLLLQAAGEGLHNNGRKLAAGLKRFEPFARDLARINGALEGRRQNIKRVITNFGLLSQELGRRDTELAGFVRSSNDVLAAFARQESSLRATIRELPGTLSETQRALVSGDRFARQLGPGSRALIPAAQALGPALRETRPLFRNTVGPIRDQIRPFTRAVQKPLKHLKQLGKPLANTSTELTKSFSELNRFVNALAYNPPGAADEGNLFWASWLNHNTNALFFTQGTGGPLRHGMVLLSCLTSILADSVTPFDMDLATLSQLSRVPTTTEITNAGGCMLVETRPPTITRILVAIGFALSCFALALFLWITFGGPIPLKAEGYRFTVPFNEATQLAQESDVRISGVSVGKVKSIELNDEGLADATIELDSDYAPIPADTRAMLRTKTLLGETFVELTPGDAQGPTLEEGGRLPKAQVADSVQLDEIFRTFDDRTRDAFQVWMQGTDKALRGRGPDLSAAIAELGPFAEETNRLLRVLDSQRLAVRQLVHDGGDVFQALSERQGQLRGLIQNSETVFTTTARRNQELADLFRILPTFQRESRATLTRLNSFARNTDPLVQQLRPAARELSPTLVAAQKAAPDLKAFFEGLRGTINASDTGFPALRRLLSDDLTPLLARLGGSVGGQEPYLAHLNSIIEALGMYKHEITAFLGNSAAAVQYGQGADELMGKRHQDAAHDEPAEPREPGHFPGAGDLQPRQPLLQAARLQPAGERPSGLRQHALRRRDHGHAAAPRPGGQRPQLPAVHHRPLPGRR